LPTITASKKDLVAIEVTTFLVPKLVMVDFNGKDVLHTAEMASVIPLRSRMIRTHNIENKQLTDITILVPNSQKQVTYRYMRHVECWAMPSMTDFWAPETAIDRELVLVELREVLSSAHFRNSSRYPKLLNYVVTKTLDGDTQQFKERTLGIEIFGREADYDTNVDPVVRVTAAEVRKRLAQHYHERGRSGIIEIHLPAGSYVPCFKLSVPPAEQPETGSSHAPNERVPNAISQPIPAATRRSNSQYYGLLCALVVIVVAAAAISVLAIRRNLEPDPSEAFWKPLLQSPGSLLAVVPTSLRAGQPNAGLSSVSHGPYDQISLSDAIALSHLTNLLGNSSKPYQVKQSDSTVLGDLRQRPVVLIGALNNHWTMSLTVPMRFHFVLGPTVVRIVDTEHPEMKDWIVDYTQPYAYAEHDYAIVARYLDPTTGGNMLIIAGIGAHATQSSSEFVTSPTEMEQLARMAPSGWEKKNLEMIVRTDVINGDASPARLVAVTAW
jgi:hypothetical protein